MNSILGGVISQFIRLAVGDAPLDSAPGEPHRKSPNMVIPAGRGAFPLKHRCPAELAAPDHQRVIKHAARFQILHQCRAWVVAEAAANFHVSLQIAVMIPSAMVQLNEARASLGQAPGEQTISGERSVHPLDAVCIEHVLRLAGKIHQLRYARLHAKRQLVLGDARVDLRVGDPLVAQAIEFAERLDEAALLFAVHSGRGPDIVHRVALGEKLNTLVTARQKTGTPLSRRDRLRVAAALASQHDEPRQVLVHRAQSVSHPSAHARPAGDGRAGIHHRVRRVVVDLLGVHRAHDRDVIGDAGDAGQHIRNLLARLPVTAKRKQRAEALEFCVLQLGYRLAFCERLRHRLAVQSRQFRLVIERLQVGRPAGHAEKNHPLGLGRKMRQPRQSADGFGFARCAEPVRIGQASQGGGTQAKRCAAQERAAVCQCIYLLQRKLHVSFA